MYHDEKKVWHQAVIFIIVSSKDSQIFSDIAPGNGEIFLSFS